MKNPFDICAEIYWGSNKKGPRKDQLGMRNLNCNSAQVVHDPDNERYIIGFGHKKVDNARFCPVLFIYKDYLHIGYPNDTHTNANHPLWWHGYGMRIFQWLTGYSLRSEKIRTVKQRGVIFTLGLGCNHVRTNNYCPGLRFSYKSLSIHSRYPPYDRYVDKDKLKELSAKIKVIKKSLAIRDKIGILGTAETVGEDLDEAFVTKLMAYDDENHESVQQFITHLPRVTWYRWQHETYFYRTNRAFTVTNTNRLRELYGAYSYQ